MQVWGQARIQEKKRETQEITHELYKARKSGGEEEGCPLHVTRALVGFVHCVFAALSRPAYLRTDGSEFPEGPYSQPLVRTCGLKQLKGIWFSFGFPSGAARRYLSGGRELNNLRHPISSFSLKPGVSDSPSNI